MKNKGEKKKKIRKKTKKKEKSFVCAMAVFEEN